MKIWGCPQLDAFYPIPITCFPIGSQKGGEREPDRVGDSSNMSDGNLPAITVSQALSTSDVASTVAQLTEVVRQLITSVAQLEEWQSSMTSASAVPTSVLHSGAAASSSLSGPFAVAEEKMRSELLLWDSRVRLAEDEERRLHGELRACLANHTAAALTEAAVPARKARRIEAATVATLSERIRVALTNYVAQLPPTSPIAIGIVQGLLACMNDLSDEVLAREVPAMLSELRTECPEVTSIPYQALLDIVGFKGGW